MKRILQLGIIHDRKDSNTCALFRQRLEAGGKGKFDIWTTDGQHDGMETKIQSCNALMVILCQEIVSNKNFELWLEVAINHGVPIFPVKARPCTTPSRLERFESYPKTGNLAEMRGTKEVKVHNVYENLQRQLDDIYKWQNNKFFHLEATIPEINFDEQKRCLSGMATTRQLSVILLEGTPKCGHDLLLYWIKKERKYNVNLIGAENFTGEFAWWNVFHSIYRSPTEPGTRKGTLDVLYNRLRLENELIIIDNVDQVAPDVLFICLKEFEKDFLAYIQHIRREEPPHPLNPNINRIQIILVNRGLPGRSFREQPGLERPDNFIALPHIDKLRKDDLKHWLEHQNRSGRPASKGAEERIHQWLENNDESYPDGLYINDAVWALCDAFDCPEFYNDIFRF